MVSTRGQGIQDVFISDDPEIRGRLAQLAFAYASALLRGDLEMAHAIRGDALLLRMSHEEHRVP